MSDAELLAELADGLPLVAAKKMFGHATLFAAGQIFALVDGDGRVGVRLPDAAAFATASALPGAGPFDPMGRGKTMSHWVILPADLLDEPTTLRAWVQRAHALAVAAPAGARKKR